MRAEEKDLSRCANNGAQRISRFAAIDIGTVTCRLLIADAICRNCADGRIDIQIKNIAKDYVVTNLGEGVDATHHLKGEAIDRVCEALKGFIRIMDDSSDVTHSIQEVSVMSTSAARDADNSDVFVDRLAELGLQLSVIPGAKEAALSFSGATLKDVGIPVMVVDIGGGSTEVSIGLGGDVPIFSRSFDIGCRRVTERFLSSNPPAKIELDLAREWMRVQFDKFFEEISLDGCMPSKLKMIAVAGTATSAVSIRERMEVYDSSKVDGSVVSLDELREITCMLAQKTLEERRAVVGLDPKRAAVIVAGMVILEEAMAASKTDAFTVSESDILDGMILDLATKHFAKS